MSVTISNVHARQIIDSRGNPTIEVEITLVDGTVGRASVPSGASTGSHEAIELRDGTDRWMGKGVTQVVNRVNAEIKELLVGHVVDRHASVDQLLIDLDGTPNKGRLGANGILETSLALARALASSAQQELWQWIQTEYQLDQPAQLPVPMLNVINGGEHANNAIDIQEFMIVPHGFSCFTDALHAACRTFHTLKNMIDSRGLSTAVGDEGGFAPNLPSNVDALELLVEAIIMAGYTPADQISIALDIAATEMFKDGKYVFTGDNKIMESSELVSMYESWLKLAPIISIEDGMSEDDWPGWTLLTERLADQTQLVGDDLFVTNVSRLEKGIESGIANAMLVKVNQIGSLSETIDAMRVGKTAGYTNVMSHRSGETEDPFIADLAVGTGCGQIKTGAPSRSDRVAKYNQLLRIEEKLAGDAVYARPYAQLYSVAR